jgi:hypothetical protein
MSWNHTPSGALTLTARCRRNLRGDAEAIWRRRYVKRISPELCRIAHNKLTLIDAAGTINDLRVPLEREAHG